MYLSQIKLSTEVKFHLLIALLSLSLSLTYLLKAPRKGLPRRGKLYQKEIDKSFGGKNKKIFNSLYSNWQHKKLRIAQKALVLTI